MAQLGQTARGSRINAAVFYLSDRRIVGALQEAIQRGARLRRLMDAKRDAFGRKKNGIPNRLVAAELMSLSSEAEVEVRWAAIKGNSIIPKCSVTSERGKLCFALDRLIGHVAISAI